MLTIDSDKSIAKRSTKPLSTKGFRPVVEMLESSRVLQDAQRGLKPQCRELKFGIVPMVALLLFMEAKGLGPMAAEQLFKGKRMQSALADLGMPRGKDGRFMYPKHAWISDFKNHVYPKFKKAFEKEVSETVIEEARRRNGGFIVFTADSTPLVASRYSKWADFNGHYMTFMAKSHMVMANGIPLYFRFTNGNAGDNENLLKLLEQFPGTKVENACFLADGGYNCAETYARTYEAVGLVLNTNTGVRGVIHEDAMYRDVVRRYERQHHREEGFVSSKYSTRDRILRHQIRTGDSEHVGWFLRNLDMRRGTRLRKRYTRMRHVCETVHRSMKRWVRYTVEGLHSRYIGISLSIRTVCCQFLCMLFKPYDINA